MTSSDKPPSATPSSHGVAFTAAAVGMAILSTGGELLDSNEALQAMLGRTADELRRLGAQGVTYPEDWRKDTELFAGLIAGQYPSYTIEKRYLHKDGHILWGRLSVSLDRRQSGSPAVVAVLIDITEQKTLESSLAESRRRYEDLFENALFAFVRARGDEGVIVEANRAAAELVGLASKSELIGRRMGELYVDPEQRRPIVERMFAAQGDPVDVEMVLRRADGTPFWARGIGRRMGDVTEAQFRDVTRRKWLEEERRVNEERLATIVETTPTALLIANAAGVIEMSNRAAELLLGAPRSELEGHPLEKVLVSRTNAGTSRLVEAIRTRQALGHVTLSIPHPEGDRTALVTLAPLPGASGMVAALMDITKRVEMEKALRRERGLLERVVDENPFPIALYDRAGRVVKVNASHTALFGAVPRGDYSLFEDATLQKYGFGPSLATLLEGETVSLPPLWYNAHWLSPDYPDKLVCIRTTFFPLFGEDGAVERIVQMVGDVTESRRLESDLIRAKEEAESADRMKTEFLSIASHELRTPLTPLALLLQRSRRQVAQGLRVGEETFTRMERQVERLTRLVEGLLDVSRLIRGVLVLERCRLDLRETISHVVEDFRDRTPDRAFGLDLPDAPVPVFADATRIEQALSNLLDNAVRYTPPGSPIEVALRVSGERVEAAVIDHGPGIAEELQQQLLSGVLVTDTRPTRQAGLGLGLFIAQRLVALHGGTLAFRTERGKGSTFSFTLPSAGAAAHPPTEQRAPSETH